MLFAILQNITHQFLPNFLPPYDTPIKKKLILEVLKEEWNEKLLTWKKLTNRFDNMTALLPNALVEGGETKQKMTAVPPKESKRSAKEKDTNHFGILDPKDDESFTHFVTCLGSEVANMTTEVCRPMMQEGAEGETDASGTNSMCGDEKSPKTLRDGSSDPEGGVSRDELLARIAHKNSTKSNGNRVKAVVSGRRVSKNHRREEHA